LTLSGPVQLEQLAADLKAVGRIAELKLVVGDSVSVGEVKFSQEQ